MSIQRMYQVRADNQDPAKASEWAVFVLEENQHARRLAVTTIKEEAYAVCAAFETLAVCKELVRLWDAGIRPQIVQGGLREEVDFAELCMVAARSAIKASEGGSK
jgi:hypothetical protein